MPDLLFDAIVEEFELGLVQTRDQPVISVGHRDRDHHQVRVDPDVGGSDGRGARPQLQRTRRDPDR